ncbi:MAG: hypothetical protein Q8R76_06035 [Candidatus Omnitrophota bacterium]|nr:hypothetical protein [Candidatus Omnitrophota bacterium]
MKYLSRFFSCFVLVTSIPFTPLSAETVTVPPGTSFEDILAKGRASANEKNYIDAVRHFYDALNRKPLHPETLYYLGLTYQNQGAPLIALFWYEAYLEAHPDSLIKDQVEAETRRLYASVRKQAELLLNLALKTINEIPSQLPLDKRVLMGKLAFIYTVTGNIDTAVKLGVNSIYSGAATDSYQRFYGQYLADLFHYKEAFAIVGEMTDPAEIDKLLYSIGYFQAMRDEHDEVEKTLEQMAPSGNKEKLIQLWTARLTRELKTDRARKWAEQVPEESPYFAELWQSLAMGYLKAGRLEEAKKIIPNLNGSFTARTISGEGALVLEELNKLEKDKDRPWLREYYFFHITTTLAWMGELELSKKGCELAKQAAEPDGNTAQGDYAELACAFYFYEAGEFHQALSQIQKVSPENQGSFGVSFFWRLMTKEDLTNAEKMLSQMKPSPIQAGLLLELSRGAYAAGMGEVYSKWITQSLKTAINFRHEILLRQISRDAGRYGDKALSDYAAQAARVARWSTYAMKYSEIQATSSIASYLDQHRPDDLRELAQNLMDAAVHYVVMVQALKKES